MRLLKVAAGVLNQVPLDWDGNLDRIRAAIGSARESGVGLLCLPELCITGYGCEDAFLSPALAEEAWAVLEALTPESRGLAVSVGLPVLHHNALFNCAALLVDGRIAGLVAKRYLAGDGLHYEPRWFKPWPRSRVARLQAGRPGEGIPLGDLFFDCGGVRIGFEICEDAWVATRPGGRLASRGVDIILNPSASHFAFGKQEIRKRYVLEGSRAFGVTYVYTNLLGNEAGRAIYDGGALIASAGRLVTAAPRFSFRQHRVFSAVVDLDLTRIRQAGLASHEPEIEEPGDECVTVPIEWPAAVPERAVDPIGSWDGGSREKEEELTRAVGLALFDYLRKSRTRGFVVSLSGGADSSAVSTLVWTMAHLAWRELGREGVLELLPHLPEREGLATPRALVKRLLTCVYQGTRNSSETTRRAARGVAEALGAEYHELELDQLVDGYVELVEEAIGRHLAWSDDDVALQNIQARARAPSVWLLANLQTKLLLATSNRSEAAVGYATMDGDTAGGLSPIAGIDKAFLRRWLRWMELEGPDGLESVPALAAVNEQEPTAELRPPAMGQTDEGDLMPYDLLDSIERLAIRDKRSPVEVFRLLSVASPEWDRGDLAVWIDRFFRLWSRNQWKRERYAPSFHVDDENLDPKTWCRFPILSGGFERELRALATEVERES